MDKDGLAAIVASTSETPQPPIYQSTHTPPKTYTTGNTPLTPQGTYTSNQPLISETPHEPQPDYTSEQGTHPDMPQTYTPAEAAYNNLDYLIRILEGKRDFTLATPKPVMLHRFSKQQHPGLWGFTYTGQMHAWILDDMPSTEQDIETITHEISHQDGDFFAEYRTNQTTKWKMDTRPNKYDLEIARYFK